ncbi:DUF6249 domain-containing protein [Caulobacter sp. KR2-114]|uniref:DUF6249 domain-containing protein n=1 Tax=Caulobacter sp. KR2-114 TaxID=3400912 RepID=UPI003C0F74D0
MWFGDIGDHLVPIMGILMIIAIVIGPSWIRSYYASRERERMHETLRTAYEKGQPVPPEMIAALQTREMDTPVSMASSSERDLRRAVVLIAVGIGLGGLGGGFHYALDGDAGRIVGGIIAGAGAIPGMIGVAYLVLWLFSRRSQA